MSMINTNFAKNVKIIFNLVFFLFRKAYDAFQNFYKRKISLNLRIKSFLYLIQKDGDPHIFLYKPLFF